MVSKISAPTENRTPFEKLGPYRVNDMIGSGTYSEVYSCTHEISGENVAIKVLNCSVVKFQTEIRLGKLLADCPNVAAVRDMFIDISRPCFVMDLIEGIDLLEYISHFDGEGMPVDELQDVFQQMVLSISQIHSKNIVHRDIKPENFLLTTEGKIKLIDFGMSTTIESKNERLTTFCGR